MKNVYKLLCFVLLATVFAGCPKDEVDDIVPAREYSVQKPIDEAILKEFLETHYFDEISGEIKLLVAGKTALINDTANLKSKDVYIAALDLSYKLYYISIDEGWSEGNQPSVLDSTFVSYRGTLLDGTLFDTAVDPVWFTLDKLVGGWAQIVPFFKSGKSTVGSNGIVNYSEFGNGIMILPSAFGYYAQELDKIPSYSPLIFYFQLKKVRHRDHDGDKVLTKDELYNIDGSYRDTDGDGVYDYEDIDDDGDGFLTKTEITKPSPYLGLSLYYPFDPVVDNPYTTLVDETEPKGIPDANGDATSPLRLRRYLDKNAKPPYTTY